VIFVRFAIVLSHPLRGSLPVVTVTAAHTENKSFGMVPGNLVTRAATGGKIERKVAEVVCAYRTRLVRPAPPLAACIIQIHYFSRLVLQCA